MKKAKLIKLRQRHKSTLKNKKLRKRPLFQYLIIFFITLILIIFTIKLIFKQNNIEIFGEKYNPETIDYKGEKVQKKKLIEEYLSRITENDNEKLRERNLSYKYLYLDEYNPKNKNVKSKIISNFFIFMKIQKITKFDIFYIKDNNNFGNTLIAINNAIFYCEIIGCNKIILKDHNTYRKWLITNPIYIEKINITIMIGTANCKDSNVLCLEGGPFYPKFVKPQIKIQYIKEELLRNLPDLKTESNDLYIHLRGGDAFKEHPVPDYPQPPLCFYEKIIDNNKFNNIYIVSMDKKNIIVDALLNKYKQIIFQTHDYKYDLSLLIHAYNIALSVSSFAVSAIKFNDNLKDLWEYDLIRLSEKYSFLHHHLYKFDIKYKIHTMKPSDIYINKMFNWRNEQSQLDLMIKDKCTYDFVITKPNI